MHALVLLCITICYHAHPCNYHVCPCIAKYYHELSCMPAYCTYHNILPCMSICCLVSPFIIWQAPRAGSMRRILCSDWLPERARWSDTTRPGLPVSFPQIKISPKFKRVHQSFLSLKLLSAKVKRSFVISLSLWNQKKRQRE